MYRERRQDKMTVDKDIRFLSRVASLPIITTAFGQLTALYKQTKDSNRLLKYTLETAEAGLKVATNTTKPIIDKLNGPSKYIFHNLVVFTIQRRFLSASIYILTWLS